MFSASVVLTVAFAKRFQAANKTVSLYEHGSGTLGDGLGMR
jgi:hypothetical protein